MFGQRKRKKPNMDWCPRCGGAMTTLSKLPACTDCGPLQGPQFGYRFFQRDLYPIYYGVQSRPMRYEIDIDNPPMPRDRPGKLSKALDR